MLEPWYVERTADVSTLFYVSVSQVKTLTGCHRDMDLYPATSDVKPHEAERYPLIALGTPPDALPEVFVPSAAGNSHTGVSIHSAPLCADKDVCWYALRTTYGREQKARDYLSAHGVETYLPLLKTVRQIGGRRVTREAPRLPNIFFARGTEDSLKPFVYDNVHLPFLRFYYRRSGVGCSTVNVPLIVPNAQMDSLRIICDADCGDTMTSPGVIDRFCEGHRVRITAGKFAGVTGIVARYRSQQRVGIIIDGLLTACTAYVPSGFLQVMGGNELW